VARELGVRYVLEGSVRRAGNRVRISAQLIDAASDKHLWAQRYDRSLEDLFSVQDEVTQSIVAVLPARMQAAVVAALRPNPYEHLDEATLNAAIALVASMKPETELQALLAVEIAAIGFAGHKLLRQSLQHLDEIHIGVYGNYALKLLRLQLDMIRALDQHRRGNKQTVEVRHVHIHSGAQGVVGIVNAGEREGGGQK